MNTFIKYVHFILVATVFFWGYANAQTGGLRSESIFVNPDKLDHAIKWEFEGDLYCVSYTNLPPSQFDFIVPTNAAGAYHATFRPMQIYKRLADGSWSVASTHFFESMSFGNSSIDYGTTSVDVGGSGYVKKLDNEYVLISQLVHVKTLGVSKWYPVFLILKRNREPGFFDWEVKLEFLSNVINKNKVKDVIATGNDQYEIIMSDDHSVRLFFNKDDYDVWIEDSKGNFKGAMQFN